MPWEKRLSSIHKTQQSNFLWAHGHSPFGPFGNSSSFSNLAVDQVWVWVWVWVVRMWVCLWVGGGCECGGWCECGCG
jgi:hypothetical protein